MLKFSPQIIPKVTADLTQKAEIQTFDKIFLAPSPFDDESTDNFISLKDISYDSARLKNGETILDVPGKTYYESTFTIDSETAIKANVRKARYAFYLSNPDFIAPAPVLQSQVMVSSADQYNQSSMLASVNSLDSISAEVLAANSTGATSKTPQTQRSGKTEEVFREVTANPATRNFGTSMSVEDGRIREIDIDLGITDQMVVDYNLWKQSQSLSSTQRDVPPPLPEQRFVIQATDAFDIKAPGVRDNGTKIKNTKRTMPPIASEAAAKLPQGDATQAALEVMKAGIAPDTYMNGFYGGGPGAGPSGPKNLSYSIHGTMTNQTIAKSFSTIDTFTSVRQTQPKNSTQRSVSQTAAKSPSFTKQVQEAITAPIEALSYAFPTVSNLTEYVFVSTVLEFETDFDFMFSVLDPKTRTFYVKIELLSKDGQVQYQKTYPVNLREQLEPLLIPQSPPSISTKSFRAGEVEISVDQTDPVASGVELYRMMSTVEELSEAEWVSVGALDLNVNDVGFSITDSEIESNYSPNLVLYEAKALGPFGQACTTTSTIVENGIALPAVCNLPADVDGEITITAYQDGTEFVIDVEDFPDTIFRVALKRQVMNNSQESRVQRNHPLIVRADGSGQYFTDVRSRTGKITFRDGGFVGGTICKYYAIIDWKDGRRTYSKTEEYIQYVPPPPPIISSYLSNMTVDTSSGSPVITLEYGASLTTTGIEQINSALGESGVASLFTHELEKDRSIISELLLTEVTRKDNKTGEIYKWPLRDSGKLIDSTESNSSLGLEVPELVPNRSYTYTAKVYVLDPERIFSEAMTRIPASTRQIITDADPNFVQSSAQRFAESFVSMTSDMQPASVLNSKSSLQERISAGYTGLSHRSSINIPKIRSQVKEASIERNTKTGLPANIVTCNIVGNKNDVYAYKIDVILDGGLKMPLASVSPNSFEGTKLSFRDEKFVHENTQVSYEVSAVYMDQKVSSPSKTSMIEAGISKNSTIVDRALSKQARIPNTSDKTGGDIVQIVAHELKKSTGLYAATTPKESTSQKLTEKRRMTEEAQRSEKQKQTSVDRKKKLNKNNSNVDKRR